MRTPLGWAPEVPNHWKVVPLNSVAKMGTGHTPDRSKPEYWENCTIPWVTTPDVTRRPDALEPLMDTEQKISQLGSANSAAVVHPASTVMLSRTASVGYSVLIGRPMATTQAFVTWTAGARLDPRYLLLVLQSMKPEWDRLAYGSTHLTIYMPDLESLRIPLPPLDEQRTLVELTLALIRDIDTSLAISARLLDLLDELRNRLLEDVLGDQHRTQALARIVDPKRPIMYGMVLPGPNVSDGRPYVKGGDVARGSLQLEGLPRAAEEIEAPYARARIRRGDLLVAIRGSGTIGKSVRVPAEVEGANITQDSARLAPAANVDGSWMELVLQAPSVLSQIQALVTGSSVKGINLEDLRKIKVPIRNLDEQRADIEKIRHRLSAMSALRARALRQQACLEERRQAIILAAATGKLEIKSTGGSL